MTEPTEQERRISEIRARVEAATPGPWAIETPLDRHQQARDWDADPDWTSDYPSDVSVRAEWPEPKDGRLGYELCQMSGVSETTLPTARLIAAAPDDIAYLLDALTCAEKENVELKGVADKLQGRRRHTQEWYASHYGKLEDWARKILPEPWRRQFFNCIANGTYDHDDVGEAYICNAGFRVVPSGYIHMDDAKGQLITDQTSRAEAAEQSLQQAVELLQRIAPEPAVLKELEWHQAIADARIFLKEVPCSKTPNRG